MLTTEAETLESKEIEDEIDADLEEVYGGENGETGFRSKWYVAGVWPFRRISFECPGCSRWLSVKSAHSARSGFCPSCDLTVGAPNVADDLSATLVSQWKAMPGTPVRTLPGGGSSDVELNGRQTLDSALSETLDQEGAWGMRDDAAPVPIQLVEPFQAAKPWGTLVAILVAIFFAGKLFIFMQSPSEPEVTAIAPALEKKKPKVPRLGSDIWVVLDSLGMAETPEEMASLVRNPAETLPKMKVFYAENADLISLPHRFERASSQTTTHEIDGRKFARFQGRCDGRPVKFSFELTQYGWRLDWESLVGYSEMNWRRFLDEKPSGEHEFRLLAKVSTDDVLEYDRQQYLCLQLTDHLQTREGFALLERHGAAAGKVRKFLKMYDNGKWPTTWVIPVLVAKEGSELLEVVDFKSASWLVQ